MPTANESGYADTSMDLKRYLPSIVRDVALFGGLLMAGVGLWLYEPWISLTVVGLILFAGSWWSINRTQQNQKINDEM